MFCLIIRLAWAYLFLGGRSVYALIEHCGGNYCGLKWTLVFVSDCFGVSPGVGKNVVSGDGVSRTVVQRYLRHLDRGGFTGWGGRGYVGDPPLMGYCCFWAYVVANLVVTDIEDESIQGQMGVHN